MNQRYNASWRCAIQRPRPKIFIFPQLINRMDAKWKPYRTNKNFAAFLLRGLAVVIDSVGGVTGTDASALFFPTTLNKSRGLDGRRRGDPRGSNNFKRVASEQRKIAGRSQSRVHNGAGVKGGWRDAELGRARPRRMIAELSPRDVT